MDDQKGTDGDSELALGGRRRERRRKDKEKEWLVTWNVSKKWKRVRRDNMNSGGFVLSKEDEEAEKYN